jgi:hypothetical protein
MSIVRTTERTRPWAASVATPAVSYGPFGLQHAYGLSTASANRGKGVTVAIVDAFSDPLAGKDLGRYRRLTNLPSCIKATGCLRIVNQAGKTSPLPPSNANWSIEISLDLDMVSAVCPKCHILLVEANNALTVNLGAAVNTAVKLGAKYVSDSWGGPQFLGENEVSHFFNHPGAVISFASGDLGFGTTFPANLQYVTSIGGTTLRRSTGGRGWTERVWGSATTMQGTASGCSNQAKPSWQLFDPPGGCTMRTQNDVAAVADPQTGVRIFDSFNEPGRMVLGGTSASTPIITAIYALAGRPKTSTYPSEYPYLRRGHLFDVTSGANGICPASQRYLCQGEPGYDGPTGLGTPNGIQGFGVGAGPMVTVVDPGGQTGSRGHAFSVKIIGLDSRSGGSLSWTATGLPAGLSIKAVPHSTDATISGTISGASGTYHVTVTAHDGAVKGSTHFNVVVH